MQKFGKILEPKEYFWVMNTILLHKQIPKLPIGLRKCSFWQKVHRIYIVNFKRIQLFGNMVFKAEIGYEAFF